MNAKKVSPRSRRFALISLSCLLLLINSAHHCVGATQSAPSPPVALADPLDSDSRLERLLTRDAAGIQMDELLKSLSSKQLALTASRNCAAQKLQIHLKQRSLRIVMQSLAELLPGSWVARKDNSGYELIMDAKAVRQRQDWWRLFTKEREKSLEAYRAYLLQQMRANLNISPESNLNPEQNAQLTAAAHDLYAGLPQALQERIAGQLNNNSFYGMDRVSFSSGDMEGATVVNWNELPLSAQNTMSTFIASWVQNGLHKEPSAIDWSGVQVCFANGGIAVQANVILPTGEWSGTPMGRSFEYPPPNIVALTPGLPGLLEAVKRLGRDAPEEWKRLAAYQQSRIWKNDIPAHPRRRGRRSPLRSQALQWLADKADIQYVADYYSLPREPMKLQEKTAPLTQSLKETLDTIADEQQMSWKQRPDDVYLFRNNRWFRDDYLEVPNALLRRWLADHPRLEQSATSKQTLAGRNKQLLDWGSEVVANLTPWQIATGLRYFTPQSGFVSGNLPKAQADQSTFAEGDPGLIWETFPFYEDSQPITRSYKTLQFYAGLEENARQALTANQLVFSDLLPLQQQEAAYLLPQLHAVAKAYPARNIRLGWNVGPVKTAAMSKPTLGRLIIVSPRPTSNAASSP